MFHHDRHQSHALMSCFHFHSQESIFSTISTSFSNHFWYALVLSIEMVERLVEMVDKTVSRVASE